MTPSQVGVLVLHPGATGRALAIKDHLVLELAGPLCPGVGAGHGVAVDQAEGEVNVPFITGGRAIVVVPQDVVQDVDPVHLSHSLSRDLSRERERERSQDLKICLSLLQDRSLSLSRSQDLKIPRSRDLSLDLSHSLDLSQSFSLSLSLS